jgi:hypothetical protein
MPKSLTILLAEALGGPALAHREWQIRSFASALVRMDKTILHLRRESGTQGYKRTKRASLKNRSEENDRHLIERCPAQPRPAEAA